LEFLLTQTHGYLILHQVKLISGYSQKILGGFEFNKKQFMKRLGTHILIPWIDFYQYSIVVTPT
jgi:hypothetical protein